jgi:regulator of telomere elongation helicase 1
LSPLQSFAAELQLDIKHTLENKHVIDAHQIFVGVVGKGPSGSVLSSAYTNRNDSSYITDLGNSIGKNIRIS